MAAIAAPAAPRQAGFLLRLFRDKPLGAAGGVLMLLFIVVGLFAPGIAEALFATALGLVAAIPASVAYNFLNSRLNRYADRLEAFTDEFPSPR